MEFSDVVDSLERDLSQVEARLQMSASVDYPIVGDFLEAIITSGGKRLRPIFLLLAGYGFNTNPPSLIPAAAGLEMLHTASLVHDDTIDQALFRRGQPTLNSAFPSETVILLGDYLFAQSAILATETMNPRVVRVFAETLGHICNGQLREIFNGHNLDQSREEYELRIFGKTASLFAAATEMGAILGGAGEDEVEQMRLFGSDVGMAFQIVDDVLDFRSTPDQTGKPVGADLRQGTVTLPTMLFLEQADGHPSATLVRRIVDGDRVSDEDVQSATAVISKSDAIDRSLASAQDYLESAIDRLKVISNPEIARKLEVTARSAVDRRS
ncbi:MAG: polyprenyl synthetase family protein [Chloroflexota bacterium]